MSGKGAKTAVIAGATGFIGRRIAERLVAEGWQVFGLARNPPAASEGLRWIAVDLADAAACRRALAQVQGVTHIFYAARYDHPVEGQPEDVETNAAMLKNLVNTLDSGALEHVHAVHGTKYYGHQLGPVPVPLTEDTPRAQGMNYYFAQEDFLRERTREAKWTYSTSRPHGFLDEAVDHARSIGLFIAVYAAIRRELGLAFDFPGSPAAYDKLTQLTDLRLLARAIHWMASEPRCANESFNVVNADTPRWCELWPRFAAWFGVEPGSPHKMSLPQYMADKAPVWDRIVAKHGLRPTRLHELVVWSYGDYHLRPEWHVVSSMAKARSLGFDETLDSGDVLIRQFAHYRGQKIIPDGGER
jgi:nucleoside-diphosphate-sugar epimerase